MKVNKYPDGSSYIEADVELCNKLNHEIVFRINTYEDLWHLNQYVDAFYNYNRQKPTVIIPNLIDAQADRRFAEDQSSGLKLVCDFLNRMNANFKIFHPHNLEVVEALMDNVEIIDNKIFIESVLYDIRKELSESDGKSINETLILMSSDAGGFKPLMKLCDKIDWKGDVYSASKSRKSDGSLTQLVDRKDFGGKDILIVDDISVYAGTFKGLAKLLKERNVGKLYLAVSHMTIQDLGDDPVTNYYDSVFTTNSKFDEYYYKQNHNKTYKNIRIKPNNLEIIKQF